MPDKEQPKMTVWIVYNSMSEAPLYIYDNELDALRYAVEQKANVRPYVLGTYYQDA